MIQSNVHEYADFRPFRWALSFFRLSAKDCFVSRAEEAVFSDLIQLEPSTNLLDWSQLTSFEKSKATLLVFATAIPKSSS